MKNRNICILFITLVIACCLLASCSQSDNYTSSSSENYNIDLMGLDFYDIEEYNAFISETSMPEGFVDFNALSNFGATFFSYVCLSDFSRNDYSSYMYGFYDENGYSLSLYVYHNGENWTQDQTIIQPDMVSDDMVHLKTPESGVVIRDGYEYLYVKGKLIAVIWQHNGIRFELSGYHLSDYPINGKKSLMSNLLSTSDDKFSLATSELAGIN